MVEAKDIATFLIEPTGSDIYDPTGFTVRKRFQDTESTTIYASNAGQTMFQDISDEFGSGSTDTGCRIYLKNGLYEINQGTSNGGLIEWSTPAQGHHVNFYIEGETRDGVIIRNTNTTMEGTRIFLVRCNFHLRNVTMDGANLRVNNTFTTLIDAFGQANGDTILDVRDCRLMRANGSSCRTGDAWAGMIVENCIVERPCEFHDQIDIEVTSFARICNNFCDRTNGIYSGSGSTITSGGGKNILISGNIIRRIQGVPGTPRAISLEVSYCPPNFEQCTISNNLIDNGVIFVGDIGTYTGTARNIFVTGNTLYQGGIYIQGPNSGTYVDIVKDVAVENNQLFDSWEAGIHLDHVGGFCTVRNNMIKNSNKELQVQTGQEPLIYMGVSNDVICENNSLYMGVVNPENPDFCSHGIRFSNLVNPTIRNNRIINRTVANPSYESVGTHTGSVLISRSL
jgi:hypothetical protein